MAEQSLLFKRGTKEALVAKLKGENKPKAGEPIYEIPTTTNDLVATKLKIGDGVSDYADLPYVGIDSPAPTSARVFQADCARGADHAAVIATVCTDPVTGDIVVVKELIAEDKRQYTAYIYNGTVWVAMDGNYSAENVYFADDLIYTKQIGELPAVPASGSATLAAAGKNVKQVLSTILAQRKQPEVTPPVASISGKPANQDVEIGTTITETGTMVGSLSAGSYTYGPATGIVATAWASEIKYTKGKSGTITTTTSATTPFEYSFTMGTDGTAVSVNFAVTATHGNGAVAFDNMGDPSDPVQRIIAGNKSTNSTTAYTCFRKMFYGTRTDVTELDSAKIRALAGEKEAAKPNNSLAVAVPVGAKRVIIAVPNNRTVTSVKDRDCMSAEIIGSFVESTIAVEGASGYTAIDYKVYTIDFANPNDKANYYDVTIV